MTGFACFLTPDGTTRGANELGHSSAVPATMRDWPMLRCGDFVAVGLDLADYTSSEGQGQRRFIAAGLVHLHNRHDLARRAQLPSAVSNVSDLAFLVRAYASVGTGIIQHLAGEFAFVIWDDLRRRIVAARDLLGVQPLYYRVRSRTIALSSQANVIADSDRFSKEFIADFLVKGHSTTISSIFDGVNTVAPSTLLQFEDGRQTEDRYWNPPDPIRLQSGAHQNALAEEFRELFLASLRMHSQREQAWVLLSGGIDSSGLLGGSRYIANTSSVLGGVAGALTFGDDLGAADEHDFEEAVIASTHYPHRTLPTDWLWRDDGQPPPLTDRPEAFYPHYARTRTLRACLRDLGASAVWTGLGPDHLFAGSLSF